jgi:hypothetical protein
MSSNPTTAKIKKAKWLIFFSLWDLKYIVFSPNY